MLCWRCSLEVPMFDEKEFAVIDSLYVQAVRTIKQQGRFHAEVSRAAFMQEQYRPMLEAYRRITGEDCTTDPSHLMHHRIAKYGPPYRVCGKPLRTPKASYCPACGADR
jgi:hypothetical protein